MRKAKGFTLAEVLITLGIIGIIAAMTVPNLVSNYRKSQAETGLRVAYSIISNAITMASTEYGSIDDMVDSCKLQDYGENADANNVAYATQAECFMAYLKPYLKYFKNCNYMDNNCLNNTSMVTNYKNINGIQDNVALLQPRSYNTLILNNGMFIGLMWWQHDYPRFFVDINGKNAPNQTGVDLFYFELGSTQLNCFTWGTQQENWCKDNNNLGNSCACKIMHNSWTIPDDYPVKKW